MEMWRTIATELLKLAEMIFVHIYALTLSTVRRYLIFLGHPVCIIFFITLVLELEKGTSIYNVTRFLADFDLPTYLVLLYNVRFWGLSWTPYLP